MRLYQGNVYITMANGSEFVVKKVKLRSKLKAGLLIAAWTWAIKLYPSAKVIKLGSMKWRKDVILDDQGQEIKT